MLIHKTVRMIISEYEIIKRNGESHMRPEEAEKLIKGLTYEELLSLRALLVDLGCTPQPAGYLPPEAAEAC